MKSLHIKSASYTNIKEVTIPKIGTAIFFLHLAVFLEVHYNVHCIYRACGGILRAPKGVIQSPNFPDEFPTPIRCEWIIHNRITRMTRIHFTQYYLTNYFTVQFFQEYENSENYRNESKVEKMNAYHDVYTLEIPAPYAVLRFGVYQMEDMNIRILEHLIDVYGFNITYEFVDVFSEKETCTAYHCSYLGSCLASADFSEYKCHCTENFFGEYCQYGPDCNPQTKTNRCQNGGICSYLNGSLNYVCECPIGYTGEWCEVEQNECYYLACEQVCTNITLGTKGCQCVDGYRLNSDGRSCSPKETLRVTIHLEWNRHSSNTTLNNGKEISSYISRQLHPTDIKSMENFTVKTERLKDLELADFLFTIEIDDKNLTREKINRIKKQLQGLINGGHVMTYSMSGELRIVEMVMGNGGRDFGGYTNENQFLTISCVVRGTNATSFRWYKDGILIDFSISPRGGYERRMVSSTEGTIRSVLYYAEVKKYDQGYYTCVASDGITQKRESFYVAVQTTPQIYMPNRQLVISANTSVRLQCFSINEPYNSFTYEWFENGKAIKWHTPNRIVESLLPAGTQLFAKRMTQKTNFTCRVKNQVGHVNVTSYVFVAKDIHLVCQAEVYKNILWPETEKDQFTTRNCPPNFGGYAERSCECDIRSNHCTWKEPSFLHCQSNQLIEIYDKVEVLRQGYRSTTLTQILKELYTFVLMHKLTLHVGDAELLASVLRRILEYLWEFPAVAKNDERISFDNIIKILDRLLTVTKDLSLKIKQKLTLGINVLQICAYLIQLPFKQLFYKEDGVGISTQNIDVQEYGSKTSTIIISNISHDVNLTSFTFRNLESHLSAKSPVSRAKLLYISDLIAVFADRSTHLSSDILSTDISLKVGKQNKSEEFECLSWERSKRAPYTYSWTNTSCSLASVVTEVVTCHCVLPVEVIVVGRADNTAQTLTKTKSQISAVVILIHVTSLCGLFVCLVVYVINWRYLVGEHYVFYANFNMVLFVNNIVFLVCHMGQDSKNLWLIGEMAVYFLYISAFSFILLEIVHFFILTSTSKNHKVDKRCSRFIIIGWGIPLVLTIFYSTSSVIFPKIPTEKKMLTCWISKSSWQFHIFMLPVAFVILTFFIFTAVVWRMRVKMTEESEGLFKRRLRVIFIKSLALLLLTMTEALLGMDLFSNNISQIIIHFMCKISLVVCVFLTRCVCESKIKHCTIHCPSAEKSFKRSTLWEHIRGLRFLREDKKSRSEMEARDYYDEINKRKYTRERKRELSFLLGSSRRSTRTDSNGSGSSRMTGTSIETSMTNVSSEKGENWTNGLSNTASLMENCKRCNSSKGTSGESEADFSLHNLPKKNSYEKCEKTPLNKLRKISETVELTVLIHNSDHSNLEI